MGFYRVHSFSARGKIETQLPHHGASGPNSLVSDETPIPQQAADPICFARVVSNSRNASRATAAGSHGRPPTRPVHHYSLPPPPQQLPRPPPTSRMSGAALCAALTELGFDGEDPLDADALEWPFQYEEARPLLAWICSCLRPSNVLSPSHLAQ